MLIEQIDDIGLEPLERGRRNLFDVLRPAIQAALLARTPIDVEAELGCDHDLLADRGKRLAHQFLVGERAVDFGGVEKRNATRLVRAFSGLPPLLPEPPTAGASVCVAG